METSRGIPVSHPLHRMFRGLTEYAFMNELGIGDPSLVGYVSELLATFVPSSQVWSLRDEQGRRLGQVAEMLAQAESSSDEARRKECHRHVGDFTLFWTGVYPEAVGKMRDRSSPDALIDFQRHGKRSYLMASTLGSSDLESMLFRRLSEQFELCAFGLSRVRKEWEKLDADGPAPGHGTRPVVF